MFTNSLSGASVVGWPGNLAGDGSSRSLSVVLPVDVVGSELITVLTITGMSAAVNGGGLLGSVGGGRRPSVSAA